MLHLRPGHLILPGCLNAMPQHMIRLARHADVVYPSGSLLFGYTEWEKVTSEYWDRLKIILGIALRTHGAGAHRIEHRDSIDAAAKRMGR